MENWIRISERKPTDTDEYLVTIKLDHPGVFQKPLTVIPLYYSIVYDEWYGSGGEILAWMPMPEPYKEDIDEHDHKM